MDKKKQIERYKERLEIHKEWKNADPKRIREMVLGFAKKYWVHNKFKPAQVEIIPESDIIEEAEEIFEIPKPYADT